MVSLLFGALGALFVLLVFGGGFLLGRKAVDRPPAAEEPSERERRQLEAEQAAFHNLLNYSTETAYKMGDNKWQRTT